VPKCPTEAEDDIIQRAYRWIDLRLFNFQPSEMMKVVMILFMANFLVSLVSILSVFIFLSY
jgi:cell division protein FtsW (lipid II flippase)